MKLIIREDDTNFFTNPNSIEMVYRNCFDSGIKISIGVTPLQEIPGGKLRTDIPKKLKISKSFNILKNKKLCDYLRKLSDEGNELCLHGVFHNKKDVEFSDEFTEKFDIFKGILEEISRKPVRTYIPPFNIVSKDIIRFIRKRNMNISYRITGKYDNTKSLFLSKFVFNNGSRAFLMKDYLFGYKLSEKKDPEMCFEHAMKEFDSYYKRSKTLILSNHYWDFFENGIKRNTMINYWNRFIDIIKEKEGIEFTTFSGYN